MRILMVGSGGREHALIRKLKESPRCEEIYCAPGNGGISKDAVCVDISAEDIDGIAAFAKEKNIDLVFVAPDDPLAAGMVDALEQAGIRAFGPRKNAAVIESSKVFSKNLMKKYGKNWVCWLIWIGIWQLADLFIHNNIIFAGPFDMALTLAGLLKDGDFWLSLFHSSLRICLGFLSAFCLGILLGSLGWAFPLVKEFLKPPMLMIRSVPVASFVILALIWIGSENLSVFISFLVVVPMIYGATLAGLENMDQKLLEMSQVFSMPFLKKVRYLFIPAVHPYLVSSCRTALGMSWKSGVAAEVIGIPKASIGEQLYYTKLYLDTSGLFAWTFSIILISAVFEFVFLTLLKKVRH